MPPAQPPGTAGLEAVNGHQAARLAKRRVNALVLAGVAVALAVCVAGPWELGRSAQRAQNREACEVVRSLTRNLADRMHATAASSRELEQESRRTAATWRAMGAAIPEQHSSGDDTVLRLSTDLAAINERLADQEERFASETDLRAADFDATVASRCDEGGL